MFIPDPDLDILLIPEVPDPGVQKAADPDPDQQHWIEPSLAMVLRWLSVANPVDGTSSRL
jgi:hypothetical protein